ncbi:hypothetical protein Tco_0503807 [Tanacetum coccineum]
MCRTSDLEEEPAPTRETSALPAPKTAKQLAAKRNQERVKSILLLAIPDEYLLKFQNVTDANHSELQSNQGSEVPKTHKSIGGSWCSNIKGKILPEFLTKVLKIDEKVFSSTPTSQNLAFLSFENTSSTNEVSTASGNFRVSTARRISQVSTTLSIDEDELGRMDLDGRWTMLTCPGAITVTEKEHCARDCISGRNQKVVKERDELKLKIEKWEESSKNLDELLNSQISARDKTGLGYDTQLNEMSNNSKTDSKISLSIFDVRTSDEESKTTNIDDEDDVSEVQTVNPVKTNDKIGQTSKKAGIGFKKIKACFVWHPEILLQDHAVVDSGCSRHMTGNKAYLSDYED